MLWDLYKTDSKIWKIVMVMLPIWLLLVLIIGNFFFRTDSSLLHAIAYFCGYVLLALLILSWAYGFLWIYAHKTLFKTSQIVALKIYCVLGSSLAGYMIFRKQKKILQKFSNGN